MSDPTSGEPRSRGLPHSRAPRLLRSVPHLLVFALGYTLFVVAGLPDVLTTRYGVSLAAFGLLTSLPLGAFVLAQPLASRLAARHSTTRVLLWAALVHALLAVALDLGGDFTTVLALRFAWGLVAGLVLSVGATHIARLSAGSTGTRSQGVYGGAMTLGGAVAFLVGGPVGTATGGFGVHALGVLPAVPAVAVCWHYRGSDFGHPTTDTVVDDSSDSSGFAVVTDPTVVLTALVYVAIIGSYVTLSTFVTAFFDDLGVVGPLNALVLVGATVGRVAGGTVGWRFDVADTTLVGWSVLVAAVGFGALAVGPTGPLLLALPFATMLAVSVPFGSVYNVAAAATDADATALALVIAAGNVAALLLPPASGALRESFGSYASSFAVLAALNVVALASAVALARGTR